MHLCRPDPIPLASWRTGSWLGLSGTIELIDVGRLNDNYDDGQNGKTQYPVIAGPDNTDVNQFFLDYAGLADTLVRGGRQAIKLDNERFIGNVEFRQVMQVFNGVTVENKSLPDTRIYAGYLGRVKTVNTRQHETDTMLLNVRYSIWKILYTAEYAKQADYSGVDFRIDAHYIRLGIGYIVCRGRTTLCLCNLGNSVPENSVISS